MKLTNHTALIEAGIETRFGPRLSVGMVPQIGLGLSFAQMIWLLSVLVQLRIPLQFRAIICH